MEQFINKILQGDCVDILKMISDKSVNCCVTSPPYYALRDYGLPPTNWPEVKYSLFGFDIVVQPMECCLGMEPTPNDYIGHLIHIFREVHRSLKKDGTLWVNIGDSYCSTAPGSQGDGLRGDGIFAGVKAETAEAHKRKRPKTPTGMKPKDLMGIPWMLAFALRDDGWYLRQDIIWSKPNPMPESVTDRCTKSHEYIFMLSKSKKYYYDADAIRQNLTQSSIFRLSQNVDDQNGSDRVPGKTNGSMKAVSKKDKQRGHGRRHAGFNERWDLMEKEEQQLMGANKRSVWSVATKPFSEAHFATFPPELIEDCILAGCMEEGTVLDPFSGSGTTFIVARKKNRNAIAIEMNPDYIKISDKRRNKELGMFQ